MAVTDEQHTMSRHAGTGAEPRHRQGDRSRSLATPGSPDAAAPGPDEGPFGITGFGPNIRHAWDVWVVRVSSKSARRETIRLRVCGSGCASRCMLGPATWPNPPRTTLRRRCCVGVALGSAKFARRGSDWRHNETSWLRGPEDSVASILDPTWPISAVHREVWRRGEASFVLAASALWIPQVRRLSAFSLTCTARCLLSLSVLPSLSRTTVPLVRALSSALGWPAWGPASASRPRPRPRHVGVIKVGMNAQDGPQVRSGVVWKSGPNRAHKVGNSTTTWCFRRLLSQGHWSHGPEPIGPDRPLGVGSIRTNFPAHSRKRQLLAKSGLCGAESYWASKRPTAPDSWPMLGGLAIDL